MYIYMYIYIYICMYEEGGVLHNRPRRPPRSQQRRRPRDGAINFAMKCFLHTETNIKHEASKSLPSSMPNQTKTNQTEPIQANQTKPNQKTKQARQQPSKQANTLCAL